MAAMRIPRNGWVIVGDGRKALFLRNDGDVLQPSLTVASTLVAPDNPATAAQGTDRPGRAFNSTDTRRSGVEQTDWHRLAEAQFARDVAAAVDRLCVDESVDWLALVAPPRTLAELRGHLGGKARDAVRTEVPKELTKHPLQEIARLLTQS
jgi:protein required for attachment to host cells